MLQRILATYLGSLVLVLEPVGQRTGMEGGQCMEGGLYTGIEGGQCTGMEGHQYICDVKCHQVEGGIGLLWAGMVGRRSLGHSLQGNVNLYLQVTMPVRCDYNATLSKERRLDFKFAFRKRRLDVRYSSSMNRLTLHD